MKSLSRALLAATVALFAVPACACDFYVSEIREPGLKRTATVEGGNIVIEWGTDDPGRERYIPIPAPAGHSAFVRYRTAQSEDGSDIIMYRWYKDVLIVDMEAFEPACDQTPQ